ncbi:MAG: hypothetical protein JWO13_2294 [Acidobacteriales bacterium]|nr:hypothetical protein [Terriglobales bacterium]
MELHVLREASTAKSTIGELTINGVHECWTLEDVERHQKIFGQTAIPCGRFKLAMHDSPHFKRIVPMLLAVPNFLYVLMHWGNTAADTEGCLLVGRTKSADFIGQSKSAFLALFAKIEAAMAAGEEVWITIEDKAGVPLAEKAAA